jgi:hypothetical protein
MKMSKKPNLAEVNKLISLGKEKGYLTYDEINEVLPPDMVSAEQIDDIMMQFGELNIDLVEGGSTKINELPIPQMGLKRAKQKRMLLPPTTQYVFISKRWVPFHFLQEMVRLLLQNELKKDNWKLLIQ